MQRAGYTLLELAFSVALAAVAATAVAFATQRGLGMYETQTASAALDGRSARSMARITQELVGARAATVQPSLETPEGAPTVWSASLSFERAADWVAGQAVPDGLHRIEWRQETGELDNGLDDNGNGLVDEGRVVLIRDVGGADPKEVVLVRSVSEYAEGELANGLDDNGNGLVDERGLSFSRNGSVLTVRVSLELPGPDGRLLVRTLQDSQAFRN